VSGKGVNMRLRKAADILIKISPFLVAIFTVTTLYASNAERLNPGQMITPLIFAMVIAGIFSLLFWLCKWTVKSAPFLASVFTGVILLWYIAPWWVMVIVLLAALWPGIRGKPSINLKTTAFIGIIVTTGILVSLIQGFIAHTAAQGSLDSEDTVNTFDYIPGQSNIYFIVPDRMPSPEALVQSGIDPYQFVQDLRDLGFYVPYDLQSQDLYRPDYGKVYTTRTMRFFASSLSEGENVPTEISYKDGLAMIKKAKVFDDLHEKGYRITNIGTWFYETANFPTADVNMMYKDVDFLERIFRNELSNTYWDRTIFNNLHFSVFQTDSSRSRVESGRHQWQNDSLLEIAASGQTSQFVMCHIILPHEPFIYTEAEDPLSQYKDQIQWTMTYLTDLAAGIRESDPTAIVIFQSDEGMAFQKPVELNYDLTLTQWNGVFAAWYMPETVIWSPGVYWYKTFEDDHTIQHTNLDSIRHTDILYLVVSAQ
jgi:hypothetical protein